MEVLHAPKIANSRRALTSGAVLPANHLKCRSKNLTIKDIFAGIVNSSSANESGGHSLGAFSNNQRKTSRIRRTRPVPKFEKSNPNETSSGSSDDDIISLNVGGRSLLTSRYCTCSTVLSVLLHIMIMLEREKLK